MELSSFASGDADNVSKADQGKRDEDLKGALELIKKQMTQNANQILNTMAGKPLILQKKNV